MSLKIILKGTALAGSATVVRLAVQLFSVPILARLLSPEDYGLAAMAMPFVFFFMILGDAGLGLSLVRTDENSQGEWHTCFWLSMALGAGLGLTLLLMSPFIASLLDQPRLTPLIATLAAILPLQMSTVVPGAALQKQRKFGAIAAAEIASSLTSIAAAIVCALNGLAVWTLILQQIIFYLVRAIITTSFSTYRPRFIFTLKAASEHISFGRNIIGARMVYLASRFLENLAIGRVHGPSALGIFAMAFQFATLPYMLVTGPLQSALYPYIAPLQKDKGKLSAIFLIFTRALATIIFPAIALVAVASEPIFHLLLSKKWGEAAPIFTLIAPAAALQPVIELTRTYFWVLGRTDVQVRLAVQYNAIWAVGLLGSVWYGIEAVAATYSVCACAFSIWSLRVCLPLVGCSFAAYLRALLWPTLYTGIAMLAYVLLRLPGPESEIMNAALAAVLAILTIVIPTISLRHELLGAFDDASGDRGDHGSSERPSSNEQPDFRTRSETVRGDIKGDSQGKAATDINAGLGHFHHKLR